MKRLERVRRFLEDFVAWVSVQPDVQGIALVGSYARGAAREDSDIDLVILTDQPQKYLDDLQWIERFGRVDRQQLEEYGRLKSLRAWYQDGREVEFGITIPSWAAVPLEAGTRRVLGDGMTVRFERGKLLSQHANIALSAAQSKRE